MQAHLRLHLVFAEVGVVRWFIRSSYAIPNLRAIVPALRDERGNVVGRSRAPRNKVRDLVFLSELSGVHKGGLQLFG